MQKYGVTGLVLLLIGSVAFTISLPVHARETQEESLSEAERIFVRSILPMFKTKCFVCHGNDAEDIRGEYDMRSHAKLVQGGESEEPAIVAGFPEKSPVYLAATRTHDWWSPMPPKENDALDSKQLAALKRWIELGALWPSESRQKEIQAEYAEQWNAADGIQVATSGGLDDDWTQRRYKPEQLWAYQPLAKIDLPEQIQNPSAAIDYFVDAKLKQQQLPPAPLADRRTLIRRATFDLIGLPPTSQDVEAFLNDPAEESIAFSKVIDRLLNSDHYGEKWGQHWLDITRYADSSGFANDFERGSAWRYRDYVIRSFNNDKPYNEFIQEQIAGDELRPEDSEALIAVGFLRMGPWELTGMEVPKVARQRFLDDATDSIGQVFLGQMLQCCRCHDHKFDPLPTRDYYSIQAALATTQLVERKAEFLPQENVSGFEEGRYLLLRQKYYQKQLSLLNNKLIANARDWYKEKQWDASAFEQALKKSNHNYKSARSLLQRQKHPAEQIPDKLVGFQPQDFGMERVARKGLQRIKWMLDRYEPYAFSVYNGHTPNLKNVSSPLRLPHKTNQGELEQTAILTGGDPFSPSLQVQPAVLSVVRGFQSAENASGLAVHPQSTHLFPESTHSPIQGRRTKLAQWVSSAQNPLTPRVMVNRIWQGHFGKAIAGNPNNFGATGKRPTHPQLLDWLARSFIDSGWSVKAMHRMMMLSQAYRRASAHPNPDLLAKQDPNQELCAVFSPRRLTAEELRDAMLQVSGELNSTMGGIPVRPLINQEAALQPRMVMGTFAEAWQPSATRKQRNRRTIYQLKLRGLKDPFLDVFNAPSPDLSTEKRDASTITPQVFSLFNSQSSYARSLAWAAELTSSSAKQTPTEIIQQLFQTAYARLPSNQELDLFLTQWKTNEQFHTQQQLQATQYPNVVVRTAVEENTGEKFTFTEPLEVADDLEPDWQPTDLTIQQRALADLCLVILNSNEFVYIY